MSGSVTRRSFLKTAAALAAAPTIITSATRRAGAAPANERIVMGIIGPGKQGLGLLKRFLRIPEVQMVAACDVHQARREYAARLMNERYAGEKEKGSYKGATAYRDFRDLLGRDDIDAVVVAVPDHWHAIVAITACTRKKDVYCEKPLSLTIYEAQQMVNAARKHERVFQTGSQQRSEYDGNFRRAAELVRNGAIGKLEKVQVSVTVPGWTMHPDPCNLPGEPVPAGLDWDFWLGPAPQRGYNKILSPNGIPEEPPADMKGRPFYTNYPNWRGYREYSGGLMTDFGAHHFDIAQWGLGMDSSGPVEVTPDAGGRLITYKYPNGIPLEKIGELKGASGGIVFIGSKGTITIAREFLRSDPASILDTKIPPEGRLYFYEPEDHKRNFVDCVKSRKRPIADVEIGARTAVVCHLGNIAHWTQKTIAYDPQTWKITGDADIAKWIDRPRRDPWQLPEF
jgi:predicted dehydrogenase